MTDSDMESFLSERRQAHYDQLKNNNVSFEGLNMHHQIRCDTNDNVCLAFITAVILYISALY